jgi:hypothetical protein
VRKGKEELTFERVERLALVLHPFEHDMEEDSTLAEIDLDVCE